MYALTACSSGRSIGADLVAAGGVPAAPRLADLCGKAAAGEQGAADVPAEDRAAMAPAVRGALVQGEPLPERHLRRP